jgi:hypothetical protein
MKKSLAVAMVLALASAPVFAAEKEKKEGAPAASEKREGAAAPESGAGKGRDWSQIDKNNDNLIQPEEMEAWLKANPGPLGKK